jgi:hypothetical protein
MTMGEVRVEWTKNPTHEEIESCEKSHRHPHPHPQVKFNTGPNQLLDYSFSKNIVTYYKTLLLDYRTIRNRRSKLNHVTISSQEHCFVERKKKQRPEEAQDLQCEWGTNRTDSLISMEETGRRRAEEPNAHLYLEHTSLVRTLESKTGHLSSYLCAMAKQSNLGMKLCFCWEANRCATARMWRTAVSGARARSWGRRLEIWGGGARSVV